MLGTHNNGATRARYLISMYGGFRFELFFYSTSTSTNFLTDFLVDSLGFSREEAVSTNAKSKIRLKPESNNPTSVLNFFERVGINKSQIKTLVSTYPALLFSDVDKTLKPKFEILQELGLSESDLAKVITRNGTFFTRGIHTAIRPNLDYLRKLLHSDGSVAKAIIKEPWLLSTNLPVVMPPNVALLQSLGFSSTDIEKNFLRNPRLLLLKTELLADAVHRVEKIFHIPRESPMFYHGLIAFSSLDESNLEMKLDIFRSFGWPDSDVYAMGQKSPYSLAISDARLSITLNFFMKELGYESSYLASHPTLLGFSLEKRVVPRNDILKLLKEKQLIKSNPCLYTVVKHNEVQFFNKYVLPFRDEVPEVYDIYIKSR